MKKQIFKNQLVNYIHASSGKSFKESRQICKAAKWDAATAVAMVLNYDKFLNRVISLHNVLKQSLIEMGEAIQKLSNSLRPIAQTAADLMWPFEENMIQNDR